MPLRLSSQTAAQWGLKATGGNKYRAVRTNGFDSAKEARRYQELRMLELASDIYELRRQPEFHIWIKGTLVCRYIADFMFETHDRQLVIEDSKGFRTPTYRLKRKLVAAVFGVEVQET